MGYLTAIEKTYIWSYAVLGPFSTVHYFLSAELAADLENSPNQQECACIDDFIVALTNGRSLNRNEYRELWGGFYLVDVPDSNHVLSVSIKDFTITIFRILRST